MLRYRSNNQITQYDFLFVLILVIYAGRGTVFVRSLETIDNLIGFALPLLYAVSVFLLKRVKFNSKSFMLLLGGFAIYFVVSTIRFDSMHPRFFMIYLISFFIVYVVISAYRFKFFVMYERAVYVLTLLSLIFWVFHNIAPTLVEGFVSTTALSKPGAVNVAANNLIYTVSSSIEGLNKLQVGGLSLIRNAGFAWESGAFSVLISLAIFINLLRSKFLIKKNNQLIVLVVGLLTTFSTTGYAMLILLVLMYMYNQKVKYIVFLTPVVFAFSIFLLSLDFMYSKVIDASFQDTETQLDYSIRYGYSYVPQRITSFIIDFRDFLNHPIIGFGGHMQARWTYQMGAEIHTISGIGKILSRFGLVGFIFFIVNLYRSSVMVSSLMRPFGWLFMFFLLVMLSFSYSLIEHPVVMCFWMFSLFAGREKVLKGKVSHE